MYEPVITLAGHVGAEPRHRVVAGGSEVTDFRLAVTPRRKVRASDDWADSPTMWFTVSTWNKLAKHCAESLKKGDRVLVSGELSLSTWTGDDGVDRSSLEVTARTVGLDLTKGTATYTKAPVQSFGVDPGERPHPDGVDVVSGEIAEGSELHDDPGFDEVAA